MINFFTEGVDFDREDFSNIKKWIIDTVKVYNCKIGNINYIFCDDKYLLDMNVRYLEHDYYTDIITFPYTIKNIISADIYISIERVKNNAIEYEYAFEIETLRVIIHGMLHLVGLNDSTEEEVALMRKEEDSLIELYTENYV